jgi:hypothetical protein
VLVRPQVFFSGEGPKCDVVVQKNVCWIVVARTDVRGTRLEQCHYFHGNISCEPLRTLGCGHAL